jgi:uncharacterized protein (TIGR00299 family) protein
LIVQQLIAIKNAKNYISGALSAMLDLGADRDKLIKALHSLPLEGYTIDISDVYPSGIRACDFNVILQHDNHDHDMDYLHGHDHTHHHDHDHHHAHRHMAEINAILDAGQLSEGARNLAHKIFDILAQAEANAHGVPVDQVHFHEVGAVDSIVDIVAAAVCFDDLGYEQVILPVLCEGTGTVRCQHGVMPIPVPATSQIARMYGLPLQIVSVQGELVTPTGAAIAAAIRTTDVLPEPFVIQKTGLGAGKRKYERPSLLRAMEIQTKQAEEDTVIKLETDIDDCSSEQIAAVLDKLMEAGANDVHFQPIYMKKNRPAVELVVLCRPEDVSKMEDILFTHTTTIGIRRCQMKRTVLPRETVTKMTQYGPLDMKKVILPDGTERLYPEYESLRKLAEKQNMSVLDLKWEG